MKILGLIPAAGYGSRWGGYFKELLPIGHNEYLLDRVMDSMIEGNASEILIITSKDKISTHTVHLENYTNMYSFKIQYDRNDLWGAIYTGLLSEADYYLFAMPDTYYSEYNFSTLHLKSNLYLGLFDTTNTSRFGVLMGDGIVDKPQITFFGESRKAWGTLVWSKKIRDFWLKECRSITNYSEALNKAMKKFGYKTFDMPYYYDMATWKDYKELVTKVTI